MTSKGRASSSDAYIAANDVEQVRSAVDQAQVEIERVRVRLRAYPTHRFPSEERLLAQASERLAALLAGGGPLVRS